MPPDPTRGGWRTRVVARAVGARELLLDDAADFMARHLGWHLVRHLPRA